MRSSSGVWCVSGTWIGTYIVKSTRINNCLSDGVHATECFYGRSRILAILKNDIPIVAMTLEKREDGWHLTEYEGPNYTIPDEGPDAPLTHFKMMLAANQISFNPAYKNSMASPQEYDNLTSDGLFEKYSNYLDNNRTDLVVHSNQRLVRALLAPGIDAVGFYKQWVVLNDKSGKNPLPLLREEAIAKCDENVKEMADAISLYLEYSERLYRSYPECDLPPQLVPTLIRVS